MPDPTGTYLLVETSSWLEPVTFVKQIQTANIYLNVERDARVRLTECIELFKTSSPDIIASLRNLKRLRSLANAHQHVETNPIRTVHTWKIIIIIFW